MSENTGTDTGWVSWPGSRIEIGESGITPDPTRDRVDHMEATLSKITKVLTDAGFTEANNA